MMQADPEWMFNYTLALARGMSVEEVEELPYNEWIAWHEYDAIRPLDPWKRQAVLSTVIHNAFTGKYVDPHRFLPKLDPEVVNPPKSEEEATERQMAEYERFNASMIAVAKIMNRK